MSHISTGSRESKPMHHMHKWVAWQVYVTYNYVVWLQSSIATVWWRVDTWSGWSRSATSSCGWTSFRSFEQVGHYRTMVRSSDRLNSYTVADRQKIIWNTDKLELAYRLVELATPPAAPNGLQLHHRISQKVRDRWMTLGRHRAGCTNLGGDTNLGGRVGATSSTRAYSANESHYVSAHSMKSNVRECACMIIYTFIPRKKPLYLFVFGVGHSSGICGNILCYVTGSRRKLQYGGS